MKKYYYHITTVEKALKILKKGLKANEDRQIFIFEHTIFQLEKYPEIENKVADHIAKNQIFLKEYVLIRIAPKGIKVELLNDNVGELTAPFQWIVEQPLIEAKYLKYIGLYIENYRDPFEPFIK